MSKLSRLTACLAGAVLATACTVYKYKDVDGAALARMGRKGRIVSVRTAEGPVDFSAKDPVEIKGDAVVGSLRAVHILDPFAIADIAADKKETRVVLKDGSRFRVEASRSVGECVQCEAVRTIGVPLDEVVRAKIRTVNGAASVLGTLAGVVLVAGGLVLDAVTTDEDEEVAWEDTITGGLIDSLMIGEAASGGGGRRRSNKALLGLAKAPPAADEPEFWMMEWTPIEARPDEDGRLRVRLDNASGAPRGVDQAVLVVVDHPPGVALAPDVDGTMHAYAGAAPPIRATDGSGEDVTGLLAARDGVFWRTAGFDAAPRAAAPGRDKLAITFPKPKAAASVRLIVNATNSDWRTAFAREARARTLPPAKLPYEEWEYSKLRVRILTVTGWQTGQALFATGPLAAWDLIYNVDLGDVCGDTLELQLSPPAGYWLVDRLAVSFDENLPADSTPVGAEAVDGPDAAEVLKALSGEDGTTLRLTGPGDTALLTFPVPPPKEGMERSFFLRTVSCYEMPAPDTHNPRNPL